MTNLYFAYGSNMDKVQMQSRCPGALYKGLGVLENFRFLINSRGVATVAPNKNSTVHGCVWTVTEDQLARLDRHEGVARKLYRREIVGIRVGEIDHQAAAYIASDSRSGVPRPGYLELILEAAKQVGLPASYIEELRESGRR